MDDEITLSTTELQLISELDARQFGFVKLNEEVHAKKKATAIKAIQYLERVVVQAHIQDRKRQNESSRQGFIVDPKTYVKLGHLHLLLEDWSKALSAYQKYFKLVKNYWKDATYLYGLGLVYFKYNSFQWATVAFQQVLYIDPGFQRANEVHLRLGIIAKMKNDFESSLKHFYLSKSDSSPCTFTQLEIRFHIAHLHEVSGKHLDAKSQYNVLLEDKNLPQQLKADIYRQMGWMHHSMESFGEKTARIDQAVQYLQKSIESEPKSGQSLYLLGRCYATIGKVHDAFIAYRNSVDKSESNADTWCSIGVLYQQQNQPMDALQAYICAVQLDKDHWAAWTNLGILYESQSQPHDALACYTNATRNRSVNPNLHQRIKYLKTQMAQAPPPAAAGKPRTLPTVEEAWNLPISNEMTNRQTAPRQGVGRGNAPNVKKDDVAANPQPQQRPPFYLTSNQLQTLQYLQNQPNLLPQQQQILQQLQHQFRLMQQHQNQMRLQAQQQQASAGIPRPIQPQGTFGANQPSSGQTGNSSSSELDGLNVSDTELESLLSQQDIGSFAESLLKQFQEQIGDSGEENAVKSETESGTSKSQTSEAKPDAAGLAAAISKLNGDTKTKTETEKAADLIEQMDIDHLDIPTTVDIVQQETYHPPDLNIKMTSEEVFEICVKSVPKNGRISTSVLPEDQPPPTPPERPGVKLSKEQLLPPTPSVYLENKKDAFSPQLQEFCLQHPITVVRGIAAALKLDLGLFSTKTLVELQPDHPVQIKNQLKQGSDENWDPNTQQQVWRCTSTNGNTTIGGYGKYQVATFQEAFQLEHEKTTSHRSEEEITGRKKKKSLPMLKYGYNVDLSYEHKFRQQLQELMKLPHWTRVVSAGNMLSHIGYQLLGMNTIRMSMKVPCARTLAHQENNNFCAININIGPGDCEWFGVPEDYWGSLQELCDKNGVNYLHGSWWPNMKDLMEAEIPVYRFLQRPGDLVWVNSGCIHWVQSAGWSNNIEWNVGPLTHKQYSLAIERYEWNKLQSFKSVVAMMYLSWNLAKNVRVSEPKLFEAIKHTLMRSLRQVVLTLEYVRSKGVEVKFHGRSRTEPAHYCGQCEVEVFGVLFIREQEKRHVVHCLDCARRHSKDLKGFVCLEEYHLKELKEVYNNFKLTSQNPIPSLANTASTPQRQYQSQQVTPPSVQSLNKSPSSLAAAQSFMGSSMASNMASTMMNSMASMTPQQQLALQQALAQQQALMNP